MAFNFSKPAPQDQADLASSIQQLTSATSSTLQNTQASCMEDALVHLETTDENFHSYELVKTLRNRIDNVIVPLVDSKVDEAFQDDGLNKVAHITEEILSSVEYTQLFNSFSADIKLAVEEILTRKSALAAATPDEFAVFSSSSSSATQYYNLDDSTTSELSSLSQTGPMFMSKVQLQSIVDRLVASKEMEVSLDTMQHLLQFPVGELVSCKDWSTIKNALKKNLKSEHHVLLELTLKLLCRIFSVHSALTTKESYTCLVEHLIEFFQGEEGSVNTLAMGIDPADVRHMRILQWMKFLIYFQNEMSSYWLRYSETIVDEVIECTVSMFSLSYANPTCLGPVHFIALLDPKATWFRRWMHGRYSRTKVLQQLQRNRIPLFLCGVVKNLLNTRLVPAVSDERSGLSDNELAYYNEERLQYVTFIHSLSLFERLLPYRDGIRLFPVKISGRKGSVSTVDILVHLVNLMYSLSCSNSYLPTYEQQRVFDPVLLIASMLKELASSTALCRRILCHEKLISLFTSPLKCAMGCSKSPVVSDEVLVLVADVVAILASTDDGRNVLLYGSKPKWSRNMSSAAHTIAKFVVHSLGQKAPALSLDVAMAWLFVCRQLYNTGEGLFVLLPYSLHYHMASVKVEQKESEASQLGDLLVDNLLNFAGTPKGLLLLQQTGLLSKCTQHMYHRYKLKLQVSRCEKFGYGYMLTQVASTAAGILELLNCGFVAMLVRDLWVLVNEDEDDHRLVAPSLHPLDPMDRTAHKAVVSLLNVFSSYPALYEALNYHALNTAALEDQSTPCTVSELIEKLVLVESSALLNYEEAHLFGLRILSVLVTCLDSFLYLDSKFHFTTSLLALQESNKSESSVIIDACSVERNRILVSCFVIGGPLERTLPPHNLQNDESYDWPMFTEYPPPSSYYLLQPTPASSKPVDYELYDVLESGGEMSVWSQNVQKAFCDDLKERMYLNVDFVKQLLRKFVSVLIQSSAHISFPKPISDFKESLTSDTRNSIMHKIGIDLVLRYGHNLGLIGSSNEYEKNLCRLLTDSKSIWRQQQHKSVESQLCSLKQDYIGFDWFVATVFLLCKGSLESSLSLVKDMSLLKVSAYLWMPRLHLSKLLPREVASSGIHPITSVTAHYVEVILQCEVPLVYSAFRLSGYTPSQICQHWIRQCFWNFLDWSQIILYISLCIVMGMDYQVYFCVSVLKHLEPQILKHTQEQNLLVFLKEESIAEFRTADWISFMKGLEGVYRSIVLPDMQSLGVHHN